MQQCLKPYGCGDTSKTVLKIVCFGKSVFCRDAPIVLNVTVNNFAFTVCTTGGSGDWLDGEIVCACNFFP